MERPLLLHSSALSEPEYIAYTSILGELADSDTQDGQDWNHRGRTASQEVDAKTVQLGEARGWIRGKYGVDAPLLDKAIALFKPNLTQPDTLIATQLFALLRLISHAIAGQDVDRSLVFVQAFDPLGFHEAKSPSPPKIPGKSPSAPFVPPRSQPQSRSRTPVEHSPERKLPPAPPSASLKPSIAPISTPPALSSNPFRRSFSVAPASAGSPWSSSHAQPFPGTSPGFSDPDDSPKPQFQAPSLSRTVSVGSADGGGTSKGSYPSWRKHSAEDPTPPVFANTNPFLSRSKSTTTGGHSSVSSFNANLAQTSPPLPPRKPSRMGTIQPPPRHPAPPPKPSVAAKPSNSPHATSTLIRQSLIAAKTAQMASENSLEKIKTWEIIKSSSGGGSIKSRHAAAVAAGEDASAETSGTTNHTQSRSNPSPPSSASSLERVANAKMPSAPASIASGSFGKFPPPRPPMPSPRPDFRSRSTSPTKIISRAIIVNTPPAPSSPLSSALSPASSTDSLSTGASRPARSHSLHNTSSTKSSAPPLPPKRKRPESVQVLSSPFAASNNPFNPTPFVSPGLKATPSSARRTSTQRTSPGHGHSHSLSSATSAAESINSLYSSIKSSTKTLLNQNELEKLRGKAEGGLAPARGYLKGRGKESEKLVDTGSGDDNDAVMFGEEDVEVRKERERLDLLGLDKGPPPTTAVLDSDDDSSDGAGMDSGEWDGWERSGDRPQRGGGARGHQGTGSNDANAQKRLVRAELDGLKAAKSYGSGATTPDAVASTGEGWSRLR